jgi:hypothetical protein
MHAHDRHVSGCSLIISAIILRRRHVVRQVALLLAASGLLIAGCGKNELGTVAVSGTVTFDGKPLDNGTVRFVPVDQKGRMALGKILEDGKFVLATAGSDGVIPGEYKISIQSQKMTAEVPAKDRELGIGGKESAIPDKFTKPETSGLTEKISGARTIDFNLTSK